MTNSEIHLVMERAYSLWPAVVIHLSLADTAASYNILYSSFIRKNGLFVLQKQIRHMNVLLDDRELKAELLKVKNFYLKNKIKEHSKQTTTLSTW